MIVRGDMSGRARAHSRGATLALTFLLLVSACSSARRPSPEDPLPRASPTFDHLVGAWFGEGEFEGQVQRWLIQRRFEGDFEVVFRLYENDRLVFEQLEVGRWGAEEGHYVTITTGIEVDGQIEKPDAPGGVYVDEYEILELTEERMIYRHEKSGREYTVRRVQPGFVL